MPQKADRQYRTFRSDALELRSADDGSMTVQGYATTFNTPYELYRNENGVVREQVSPDAFADTDMTDVIMQYDHTGRVFARKRNGTLEVEPDSHGLHIRADLGGTTLGRQLYEEIEGGYTDRMSFGFTIEDQEKRVYKDDAGMVNVLWTIRRIRKLFDVSAVSLPANDTTEIAARSLYDGLIAQAAEELRNAAADTNPETEEIEMPNNENPSGDVITDQAEETRDAAEESQTPETPNEEVREMEQPIQTAETEAQTVTENADEVRTNLESMAARNAVANGDGTVLSVYNDKEVNSMTVDEIRSSAEYVNAFARYLTSGDPRECRTMLKTENASGNVPVPVLVDDIIRHAWESEEILSRVRKTNFRGNLKVAFERSADGAYVHTEGTSAPTEEDLALGIVTMIPANIKKWIRIPDEVVTMGGETMVRYIYEELSYQIVKKLASLVIADIVGLDTSNGATAVGAASITAAPSVTAIAEAFANLSDEATDAVIIMNKLTYADFIAAQAAANFNFDPFRGMPVLFTSALPAYSTATAGTGKYCIVGDLKGAQVNYPEGEGVIIKWDDLTEAEADLVKIVGRQYAAHAVTAPFRFTRIIKPSAGT